MKPSRILYVITILGSVCSITGITGLWVFRAGATTQATEPSWIKPAFWIAIVLLLALLFALLVLSTRLATALRLAEGRNLPPDDRAKVSRAFAKATLRSIRIFAGDLSWFEEDLLTYKDLRKRDVQIQILTDTPDATAIHAGKAHGIEFRQYPDAAPAPLKASITDADEESESRALIVKRRAPRPHGGDVYGYWMKEYHGSVEYPPIRAMTLLFDSLWQRGRAL